MFKRNKYETEITLLKAERNLLIMKCERLIKELDEYRSVDNNVPNKCNCICRCSCNSNKEDTIYDSTRMHSNV